MDKFIVTVSEGIKQLREEKDKAFTLMMKDGSMSIEYFAPKITDTQKPHRAG